jgi:hypothetical protein
MPITAGILLGFLYVVVAHLLLNTAIGKFDPILFFAVTIFATCIAAYLLLFLFTILNKRSRKEMFK